MTDLHNYIERNKPSEYQASLRIYVVQLLLLLSPILIQLTVSISSKGIGTPELRTSNRKRKPPSELFTTLSKITYPQKSK